LERAKLIVLVVIARAWIAAGNLAVDEQHRDGIRKRSRDGSRRVECAGSAHSDANAGLASRPRRSVSSETRPLFVSGENMANARLAVHCIVQRCQRPAGVTKHLANAVEVQSLNEQIAAGKRGT